MKTFRQKWDGIADHLCTSPHRRVTFYPSPEDHRMRVTVDVDQDTVTLYRNEGGRWMPFYGFCVLGYFPPRKLAALIRRWLAKEMKKRFPERPD